jgi:GAF domain-containing protein
MLADDGAIATPIGQFAEVARLLASSVEPEAIVQAAVEATIALTGAVRAAVALPHPDGLLRWEITGGPVEPVTLRGYAFSPGEGIVGRAFAERRAYRIDDLRDDARSHRPDLDRETGVRAFMAAPLIAHGQALGVLATAAAGPGVFTAEHEELLRLLADQAAVALHNARLLAETRRLRAEEARRARRAELLADALGAVAAAGDLHGALEALVRGAVALLDGRRARLRFFGRAPGLVTRRLMVTADGELESPAGLEELPPGSIGARLAAGEPAVLVEDYATLDPAAYPYHASVLADGMRSGVHVPIDVDGRRIGTLHVDHSDPGFYGPTDLALAQALAAQAGATAARTALLEELEAILDAAEDTVLVYAADGQLLRTNRRGRANLVQTLGEVPPTLAAFRDRARPRRDDGTTLADDQIGRALRGEVSEDELTVPGPGGTERRIHVKICPIREGGEVRAILIVSRDITTLHRAIADRGRLEGAIAAARTVAHELNNRLQVLMTYAELLPSVEHAAAVEMAPHVAVAAEEIATTLGRLQQIVRFEETATPVGPALDLTASSGAPDAAGQRLAEASDEEDLSR